MLSKVAERMYWFGRYIERAENTARMVSVNNNLLLDLPRLVKNMWADLINISGYSNEFYARFGKADERNVIKFMLADSNNPGSILNSINMARENARTTRELLSRRPVAVVDDSLHDEHLEPAALPVTRLKVALMALHVHGDVGLE